MASRMRGIARLDRHVELGALGRHVEKQPAVIDLEDVGAELAERVAITPSTPGRSEIVRRNDTIGSRAPARAP